MYRDALQTVGVVVPELMPVAMEEIIQYAGMGYPVDLIECWLEIGCGFFSRRSDGTRVTSFQNRLLGPDEIHDLKTGGAFPENDPFEIGMPFFETADMRFLILRADRSIVHQSGVLISESLERFLRDLIVDPEFWLRSLRRLLPNLKEHGLSPWLDQADDMVLVKTETGDETLPGQNLGNGIFRICCIPFRAYDIDHGDEVLRGQDGIFASVARKSGNCGFRFRTDREDDSIQRVVTVVEKYGCTVEFCPHGTVIGVNAPHGIDQEQISGILLQLEEAGNLEYETIRR